MTATRKRHRWGERNPSPNGTKTERVCENGCGIIRVTRHEGNQHWVEFWREGAVKRIDCERTPLCEPITDKTPPAGRPANLEA